MSRTTLCVLTASALATLSLGVMAGRWLLLGDEVRRPIGPGTWKLTLNVQGTSQGHARLFTATPLDLDRQHLIDDSYSSDQLHRKPPEARHPERRRVVWSQRPGPAREGFAARSEFLISLAKNRHVGGSRGGSGLYAAPRSGEHLGHEPLIEAGSDPVSEKARELTAGLGGSTSQLDTAQALFHFVEQKVRNDSRADPRASALACLEAGKGDRAAKARLLVALLRNRNIPARIVTGVTLARGPEQQAHYWAEAFVYDNWMPMDPYHRHFGRVPTTYIVFGFGDRPVVTAKRVADLRYSFLVERLGKEGAAGDRDEPAWKRALKSLSLYQLAPGDRRLVEVLLLMPLAALIVCVFRNVVGMGSFGTFTPALIGLAFHDLNSWPGIFVFVAILLVGWLMRKFLDGYHLLQVPRVALMLTLIMSVLIGLIVACNYHGATPTRYISLFPLVILTGMVERFWTLETEDSTLASFKTLFQTLFISLVIAVVLSRPLLVKHLFCFPETLGLVMAAQLLIGRYTGYRLTELFRFRDFLKAPPPGYSTQEA